MFPARTQTSRAEADPLSALPFDALEFESRVAWMFGSPRTGSTWLMRMLVHPLKAGQEPSGLSRKRLGTKTPVSDIVVPVNESHLPVHLTPLRRVNLKTDEQGDPEDFIVNARHTGRPSYVFSDAHNDVAYPWLRAMVLARFHSQAEAAIEEYGADDCVVVIKEPNGSHGAHRVMPLMPRSKLIFLMRDGRDVIDSSMALRLPGRSRELHAHGIKDEKDRLRYVRRGSRLWVNRMNAVQRAYDAHDESLRLKVRYEDLRNNTVEELSRLVDFLGLKRTPEDVTAAVEAQNIERQKRKPKVDSDGRKAASSGGWRDSLRPKEQEIAQSIMAEKLAELGYE
jgi:hypothetical protein